MESITIPKCFDAHNHSRDPNTDMMRFVVPHLAQWADCAIFMPNTSTPLTHPDHALAYIDAVSKAADPLAIKPLVYLKLVPGTTTPDLIKKIARCSDAVPGLKLYCGPTTNNAGFEDVEALADVFAAMEEHNLILSVHGETVKDPILMRESRFLPKLRWICRNFRNLRIVLEHVSTEDAVNFVMDIPDNVRATITIHHLILTIDDILAWVGPNGHEGINPHHYCKPVVKFAEDRAALVKAIKHPKFMLGTDSAPHVQGAKECACGCAGVYTAFTGMQRLVQLFEESAELPTPRQGETELLEAFTSGRAVDFFSVDGYGEKVTFVREEWTVPRVLQWRDVSVVPFGAGKTFTWRNVAQEEMRF